MPKFEPLQCWGFAWINGKPRPFVTSIIAYSRKDCQNQAEETLGMQWKRIYRTGGRAVRCTLTPNVELRGAEPLGEASLSNAGFGPIRPEGSEK